MTRIDHSAHGHDATPAARAACRKARQELLVDLVESYGKVVRLAKVRPNSREWRAASRAYMAQANTYAGLANMNLTEVSEMVNGLASMPVIKG